MLRLSIAHDGDSIEWNRQSDSSNVIIQQWWLSGEAVKLSESWQNAFKAFDDCESSELSKGGEIVEIVQKQTRSTCSIIEF